MTLISSELSVKWKGQFTGQSSCFLHKLEVTDVIQGFPQWDKPHVSGSTSRRKRPSQPSTHRFRARIVTPEVLSPITYFYTCMPSKENDLPKVTQPLRGRGGISSQGNLQAVSHFLPSFYSKEGDSPQTQLLGSLQRSCPAPPYSTKRDLAFPYSLEYPLKRQGG